MSAKPVFDDHHVEVYSVKADEPKRRGRCLGATDTGIWLEAENDGTHVQWKTTAVFVPYATIARIDLLEARTPQEQEAKRASLEDLFRRMHLETMASPSEKQIEALGEADV